MNVVRNCQTCDKEVKADSRALTVLCDTCTRKLIPPPEVIQPDYSEKAVKTKLKPIITQD